MKFHLIGICGTGMGSLAGLLLRAGHTVRGSDEHVYPPMSTQLAALGIPVFEGFRAENLNWGPDLVVVGNVCRKDHVEVVEAQRRGLELTSFPAVLSRFFLAEKHSLVVAGTHGKTTTSSLTSFVLYHAGRDPSFLIGGVPIDFGQGWRLGSGPDFVVEGDEYDTAFFDKGSKFLHYRPQTAILTSVEFDHADIFANLDAVKAAFAAFVRLIPAEGRLVVAASSPHALDVAQQARCPVITYGLGDAANADFTGEVERGSDGTQILNVRSHGHLLGTVTTRLLGRHNAENILGVIAAVTSLGVPFEVAAEGVRRFSGVKRRQEVRGVARGVTVIDDFAHHPTAVRLTLEGLRAAYGTSRLVAVFEPRSATSRRKVFQQEYAHAFDDADEVLLAPLHAPEKVPVEERLDVERLAADLASRGKKARVVPTVDAMVDILASLQDGAVVVVMSSGGFGGIHEKILARLRGEPPAP